MMASFKKLLFALLAFNTLSISSNGQETLDKIIAVVGKNRIILQSDMEMQLMQMKEQKLTITDSIKCSILQQMILQKMFAEQADRDSLIVSDEEVESKLENRIRYFVNMYGSKEKLEETLGKTTYQLKDENRDLIKEQMMAERMQGKVMGNISVTPSEVRAFFNQIPKDSLPFFPATVELGQIIIAPYTSKELDQYAKEKLNGIRNQIINEGKSFETLAGIYSDDPGSRDNGGELTINRTEFDPAFVTAAYKLKDGEISPLVKSNFGYHIIQMIKRQGELAKVRHILVKIDHSSGDYKKSIAKLDSVRAELISGKIKFEEAVGKYTTDENSKQTGGMLTNQRDNSIQIEIAQLDPSIALIVDSLSVGSFSQPHNFTTPMGEVSCRIVYLKNRSQPHKANLKDDYSKIQQVALEQKKGKKLTQWMNEKMSDFYLKVSDDYANCEEIKKIKQ